MVRLKADTTYDMKPILEVELRCELDQPRRENAANLFPGGTVGRHNRVDCVRVEGVVQLQPWLQTGATQVEHTRNGEVELTQRILPVQLRRLNQLHASGRTRARRRLAAESPREFRRRER